MELLYVSLLCLFVLLVSLSLHFLFFKNRSGLSNPLPPGTTGWMMIGESLEFLSGGWKGFPEKFVLHRMTKYSSTVFKTHLFGEKVAVFCGAPGHKFLFSNENKLVQAWWPSTIDKLFPSSGSSLQEEAMRMKNMAPAFLKPEALQRYIGVMDSITGRHFSSDWENKEEVKALPLCKLCTFWIAAKLFVSVEDPDEVEKLLKPLNVLASGLFSVPINLPGTPFNRAIKASNQIRKIFSDIIKQRKIDLGEGKASATQDIMSHMLTTSDENGKFMPETEVVNKILGLLLGGYDTATSACAFMVKYLAELPEIYEGVYKEQMEIVKSKGPGELLNWSDIQKMKYSWNVACEVLRLAPPVQGNFKEPLTDFMYKGFSVPKGWKIYWTVNTTHRNAEYFPEPEKFNPARFEGTGPAPYTFIPFGGGPRMCPGKEYARLVILIFVHHLVKRFRFEKVIPDEKIVVDPMAVPAKGLPVRLYPHAA